MNTFSLLKQWYTIKKKSEVSRWLNLGIWMEPELYSIQMKKFNQNMDMSFDTSF